MQKWHMHTAFGRVKPCILSCHPPSSITVCRRQFHSSTPHAQDASPDKVLQEAATPHPSRSKRLEDASRIQKLYVRSPANDEGLPGSRNPRSNRAPIISIDDKQTAIYDAKGGGVPLSKDELERNHPPQRKRQYQRNTTEQQRVHPPSPTARSSQVGNGERFTMGRRPAASGTIDARQMDAQPSAPRFPMNRTPVDGPHESVRSQSTPRFTITHTPVDGPSESGRSVPGNDRPRRFQSPRDNTEGTFERNRVSFDQSTSRAQGQGRALGRESRPPSSTSGGPGRKPRVKRAGGGSRPRPTGRSERGGNGKIVYSAAELEWIKEREREKETKPLVYEPSGESQEGLDGLGPGWVSGEWGMRQMLQERVGLAARVLDGEFIQWDSKEQKTDVFALVEQLKGTQHGETKEGSGSSDEPDGKTQALMQKLFGGSYALARPQQANDVLGHVARQTVLNESYFPDDGKSLLDKVQSLVVAQQSAGRQRKKPAKAS